MLKLAITVGSTRPGRVGEAVARWVYELARRRDDAEFELVDIKDFNLPLLDEPVPPSQGKYSKPHTKAWAAKIASFDAYVFVTPEYNLYFCVRTGSSRDPCSPIETVFGKLPSDQAQVPNQDAIAFAARGQSAAVLAEDQPGGRMRRQRDQFVPRSVAVTS